MFISARKVIKQQKNKDYEKIPKELLTALNKNASDKFNYYAPDKTGAIAMLDLKGSEPILASLKIKEIKEIPDEVNGMTFNEIQQYAYNTQQKIRIKFTASLPKITDKKKEYPLACRIYDGQPLDSPNCESELLIDPPPFQSKKIQVQVDDITEEMDFIQEKSEDAYTFNYRAKGRYFSFRISFYTKMNRMNATDSVNLYGKVSLKDIIRTLEMHHGFCTKTITVDGRKLLDATTDKISPKISRMISALKHDISWWKHIQQLEGVFQQEIFVSYPLSKKQILLLDKLYISLILKKAYISECESVDTIQITLKKAIDDCINGKVITFTLRQLQRLSLIGIDRYVYEVIYLCNAKVLKYNCLDSKKNEYKIKLGKDSEHKTYIAHRYFLTKQEAEQNLNSLPDDVNSLSQFDIANM